jgi:hypothetical protein
MLGRERGEISLPVGVELNEYEIPNFDAKVGVCID